MFGLHIQLPDFNSKRIKDKFIYLILLDKVKYSQKTRFLMRSLSLLFLAQLSNVGTKIGLILSVEHIIPNDLP